MCLHRLWQASRICMCWATAIKNLQHCSRESSFCWCTPTTSMGKVSVAYETSWNLLLFLCWSLCYQSSAPCKEIKSLQDILINCWQDICSFFWFFWWNCIWNGCIPSMSHRCRLHNEYITGIPQRTTQISTQQSCHCLEENRIDHVQAATHHRCEPHCTFSLIDCLDQYHHWRYPTLQQYWICSLDFDQWVNPRSFVWNRILVQ